MIDGRERFEQAFRLFEMEEPALERLYRRRDRRQRNQRTASAGVAITIVTAGVIAAFLALRDGGPVPLEEPTPARTETFTTSELRPRLSYVAPPGWEIASEGFNEVDIGDPLRIWVVPEPDVGSYDCTATPLRGPSPDTEDLAGWLTQHPALSTSEPLAVTIGGIPGVQLDLRPSSDARSLCGTEGIPLLVNPEWGYPYHPWWLGFDDAARVYVLREPGAKQIVIVVSAPSAELGARLQHATPIIESFAFNVGAIDQGGSG